MRKIKLEYENIKSQIAGLKETRVTLLINKGRKKIIKLSGVLVDVYPSVFTVKIEGSKSLDIQSYSFSDVLCGDVKVLSPFFFERAENGCPAKENRRKGKEI